MRRVVLIEVSVGQGHAIPPAVAIATEASRPVAAQATLGHVRIRLRQASHCLSRARQTHETSSAWAVTRFLDLYVRRLYSIAEIEALDLMNPRIAPADLERRQSKEMQLRLQQSLNPKEYLALTEDKAVFATFCRGAGLPTPRYFGCLVVADPSLDAARQAELRTSAVDVLAGVDAAELVIKPAWGAYGEGISFLRQVGGVFRGDGDTAWSAAEVHARLSQQQDFDTFVVQERLHSHRDMVRLTGTRTLQTVRMVTYVGKDDSVAIGCCQWRVVGGASAIDNFRGGRCGNLLADLPGARGIVAGVFGPSPSGAGLVEISHHPSTGERFEGFRIPCWDEALRVVEAAARAFHFVRTIGWDVAITDDGVFLIEGNATWDPAYEGEVGGEILNAIRADRRPGASVEAGACA